MTPEERDEALAIVTTLIQREITAGARWETDIEELAKITLDAYLASQELFGGTKYDKVTLADFKAKWEGDVALGASTSARGVVTAAEAGHFAVFRKDDEDEGRKRVTKSQAKVVFINTLRASGGRLFDEKRFNSDPMYRRYIDEVFVDGWKDWTGFGGDVYIDEVENPSPLGTFIAYFINDFVPQTEPALTSDQYTVKLEKDTAEDTADAVKIAKGVTDAEYTGGQRARTLSGQEAADAAGAEQSRADARELRERADIRRALKEAGLLSPMSTPEELVAASKLEDAIYGELAHLTEQGIKVDFDTRVANRVTGYAFTQAKTGLGPSGFPQLTQEYWLLQSDAQLAELRDKKRNGEPLTPEEEEQFAYLTQATNQLRGLETRGGLLPLTPAQQLEVETRAGDIVSDDDETKMVPITFDQALRQARVELGYDQREDLGEVFVPDFDALLSGGGTGGGGVGGGGVGGGGVGGGGVGGGGAGGRGGAVAGGPLDKAKFISESDRISQMAMSIGFDEFGEKDVPFLQYLRDKFPETDFTEDFAAFEKKREFDFFSKTAKYDVFQEQEAMAERGGLGVPTFTDPLFGAPGGAQGGKGAQAVPAPEPLIPVSFTDFTRERREKLRTGFEAHKTEKATGEARDRQAAFGTRSR